MLSRLWGIKLGCREWDLRLMAPFSQEGWNQLCRGKKQRQMKGDTPFLHVCPRQPQSPQRKQSVSLKSLCVQRLLAFSGVDSRHLLAPSVSRVEPVFQATHPVHT